jgi:hypothetical protein
VGDQVPPADDEVPVPHLHDQVLPAIRTGGRNGSVPIEEGQDPERVPDADPVPAIRARSDRERSVERAEGVSQPDAMTSSALSRWNESTTVPGGTPSRTATWAAVGARPPSMKER